MLGLGALTKKRVCAASPGRLAARAKCLLDNRQRTFSNNRQDALRIIVREPFRSSQTEINPG